MTLIEVVTGLVILGTVLASLAIARGRFARQWAAADRKLATTRALDALIADWLSSSAGVPPNAQGLLAGTPDCFWRTRAIGDAATKALDATIVRVEVFQRDSASNPPVLTIDLLAHLRLPPAVREQRSELRGGLQ